MKDTIFIIGLIFFLAITNLRAATMFMIQTTQLLLTYDKKGLLFWNALYVKCHSIFVMKQEMGLKTHTLRRRLKLPHLAKTNKNVHKSGIFFLYFEIIAAKKSIKCIF